MQSLSEKSRLRLGKFKDWVGDTAEQIERGDTFKTIEQMLEQIDYAAWLRENSTSKEATC